MSFTSKSNEIIIAGIPCELLFYRWRIVHEFGNCT